MIIPAAFWGTGLILVHNRRYKFTIPLILALTISSSTWFTIEFLVANSPEVLFERLARCQVTNVSAAATPNPCSVSFEYDWIPQGFNPSKFKDRLVSVERVQLAPAAANISFDDCISLANEVNASLVVGESNCFKLSEVYAGYRRAFDCASVSAGSESPGSLALPCFTLFAPRSSHQVSTVSLGVSGLAAFLLVALLLGIAAELVCGEEEVDSLIGDD